jgi:transposase
MTIQLEITLEILIADLVGVSENTIRDYFESYQQGGVEKLKKLNYYCPESVLNGHIVSLDAHFQANPPASIKEAQSEIENITGVKCSETQVAEFLKKTPSTTLSESGHASGKS